MARSRSFVVLVGVLFVASALATGTVVRQLLTTLGRNAQYAADVGGLAAVVTFLLLAAVGLGVWLFR